MSDILVTGFSNFGNIKHNPSEQLINDIKRSGLDVSTHVFKTSYKYVDAKLPELLAKHKPKVVLMFGYAGRSASVRLEKTARLPKNLAKTSAIPTLARTLPLENIYSELSSSNISVIYSEDAGSYLCNYLFYKVGEIANERGIEKFGFIHIPNQNLYERAHKQSLDILKTGLIALKQM